ncbi:MAG: AtpZ/AtpI family protein [Chitinophagales bacterium]|nr:AtpZ/AtpI family protein [Chitinophagales bacterium]MDW8417840.1 AtpZ/AtpI family protein [Chitinophagales bacterium]
MNPRQPRFANALKYSGLGFQIIATALLGFFIGHKCDQWLGNHQPYLTLLISVLFLVAGLYHVVKTISKS